MIRQGNNRTLSFQPTKMMKVTYFRTQVLYLLVLPRNTLSNFGTSLLVLPLLTLYQANEGLGTSQ